MILGQSMKAIRSESQLPVLLLSTKLYPPSLPARPVPRSRLVSQLEDGLHLGRRLSLVSAQAGFGKTSLVAEWLASSNYASTWLSLDEGDNDPVSGKIQSLPDPSGRNARS